MDDEKLLGQMTRLLEGADWSRVAQLNLGPDVYAFEIPRGEGNVSILWFDPRLKPRAEASPAPWPGDLERWIGQCPAE